jgi:hydrogenase maturation factor
MSGCSDEGHCVTCGDVADRMVVLHVDPERCLALCEDAAGAHHTVEVLLVGDVAPGDEVLVHAGTAIA